LTFWRNLEIGEICGITGARFWPIWRYDHRIKRCRELFLFLVGISLSQPLTCLPTTAKTIVAQWLQS
jgi:hypothetical protein